MKTIFEQQIKGFRYLFYTTKDGNETFSVVKTGFFIIYLFAMFSAFLQFATRLDINSVVCTSDDDRSCEFIPDVFGQIFHILTFILVISGILWVMINKVKRRDFAIKSLFSWIIWFVLIFLLTGLIIASIVSSESFFENFSSVTEALVTLWILFIEPVLFYKGLIILLEIISEDYTFDGFTKTSWISLFLNFLILVLILIVLYSLIIGYAGTSNYTLFPGVEVNYDNLSFIFGGALILIIQTLCIMGYYFIKERKYGPSKIINYQKGIIPWVTFYGLVFLFVRGIPGGFIWDDTLRSLTNLFDILFLFLIIGIGINGIINLPIDNLSEKTVRFMRPLTWLNGVPKYSKVLFLFFLGAQSFYKHLEQEAVSVLTGVPNSLANLKAGSLFFIAFIGYFSVFMNFRPKNMPEDHVGPAKFLESSLKDIWKRITKKGSETE